MGLVAPHSILWETKMPQLRTFLVSAAGLLLMAAGSAQAVTILPFSYNFEGLTGSPYPGTPLNGQDFWVNTIPSWGPVEVISPGPGSDVTKVVSNGPNGPSTASQRDLDNG